jgi:hypothetical protein
MASNMDQAATAKRWYQVCSLQHSDRSATFLQHMPRQQVFSPTVAYPCAGPACAAVLRGWRHAPGCVSGSLLELALRLFCPLELAPWLCALCS